MAKSSNRFKLFLLMLFAFAFGGCVIEGGVRMAPSLFGFNTNKYNNLCRYARGENPSIYEARPHTIYRLKPGPGINSLGFADAEWAVARKPGVPRIACLGGSTTQDGIGIDRPTYPKHLAAILKERLGCDEIEALNFGIDGWTTAETMTNYFLNVADYQPDLIIIQHAVNDVWPRIWPGFKNDYSHYRTPYKNLEFETLDGSLFLVSHAYALVKMKTWGDHDLSSRNTVPVENRAQVLGESPRPLETTISFRQNIQAIIDHASARGVPVLLVTIKVAPDAEKHWMRNRPKIMEQLKLGTIEHNDVLRELAASGPAHLVDIAKLWEKDFETLHFPNYSDKFVHVNGAGNQAKALLMAGAIQNSNLLDCE